MWWRVLGPLLIVATVAVLAVGLESYLLSIPIGQVEVTVVRLESGTPQEEIPASYRHVVKLADGSEHRFFAERMHQPGERLIVTASRGRLTGRRWLGVPYRVTGSPTDSR